VLQNLGAEKKMRLNNQFSFLFCLCGSNAGKIAITNTHADIRVLK
jgi:hypothetical protein